MYVFQQTNVAQSTSRFLIIIHPLQYLMKGALPDSVFLDSDSNDILQKCKTSLTVNQLYKADCADSESYVYNGTTGSFRRVTKYMYFLLVSLVKTSIYQGMCKLYKL